MKGKNLEKWQELCAQAAIEQDPKRLAELTREILKALDEKEMRLRNISLTESPPE